MKNLKLRARVDLWRFNEDGNLKPEVDSGVLQQEKLEVLKAFVN